MSVFDLGPEDASERWKDAPEDQEPAHCRKRARADGRRRHEDMHHENIEDYGAEQRERERDVTIDDQKYGGHYLEESHDVDVSSGCKHACELAEGSRRERASGDEVQKGVAAKKQ